MSNKAHLRPHKRPQQGGMNRMTALLMALLFIVLVVVAVAMVSSGHGVPPGVR
jgi:preprotein translocase subunit SecG